MRASFRSIRKGSTAKSHISTIISKPQSQCAPVLSKHSYVVAPSMHNISKIEISPNGTATIASTALGGGDGSSLPFNSDELIDNFISRAATMPLYMCVESFLKERFGGSPYSNSAGMNSSNPSGVNAIYWQEIPNLQILYSPTMKMRNDHSTGIVGSCYFQRTTLRIPQNSAHPSFSSQIDGKIAEPNASLLLFPLFDWRNALCAIAEVVSEKLEFTQEDEIFANWFANKFKLLSKWFKQPFVNDSSIHEIMELHDKEQFINITTKKMCDTFDCQRFEIWTYVKKEDKMTKFFEKIPSTDSGIVGDSLTREQTINAISNRLNSSYNPKIDGDDEEAVLTIPVTEKEDELVHSIVLRGSNHELFTKDDEDSLKKLAPFVLLAFANAQEYSGINNDAQSSRDEQDSLTALLDVVELLSQQLEADKLTDLILEKGRTLTNSDRCSLFLVNETKENLASYFQTGLSKPIVIPITNGIAGKTLSEKKIFNIPDAYESEFFDSTTDRETGYRTKTLLSVPIYSTRGEVIGVTQMVNKKGADGTLFTDWDGKIIQVFNIFCGIALENAKLFAESLSANSQLRSFLDTALSLTKTEDIKNLLNEILKNARETIDAERGSIFIYDETSQELSSFLADGGKVPPTLPMNVGIAASAIKAKKGVIENDAYHSPDFNRAIDVQTGYKTRSIIAAPIIAFNNISKSNNNSNGKNEDNNNNSNGSENVGSIIGIVEILNKKKGNFVEKDLETVNAFASFCSIALQNSRLKEIAQFGDVEIDMNKYLAEGEKPLTDKVPDKLVLTDEEKNRVRSLNCFAGDFKGIGHFKELFYFYSLFNLLDTFKVTNERFYRFIYTIRSTYTQTSYHNWTHACDVTQFITYQLVISKADQKFRADELFIILTAGVCHDANHRGLNNVYNVKAETPLGILFKDQSVMEMHHITVSIPIISQSDINLFAAFEEVESKKTWNLFIKIILATDMAQHFALVKKGQGLIDNKEFSWEDNEHRILAMQTIIKVSDISNVSRPFEYADKWCDILNEEFFHQGDLEKASGIGLTSPLNDREHPDKPKSQIGFYNFICLPLYTMAAGLFPELQVNVDSVKSNLEQWKKLAAAKAAQDEANKSG